MSKYQFNMQIISYQKIELYKNGIANGNKNLKCIIVFNHVKMYLKKVTNFVFVLVWFLSCLDWGFLKLVCFTKVLRA
jgi:hypothetical protein